MLGQLRIFERSHLNKVSFELHLPWRVGVTPFSYKTGCTSQSCQNSLITSPWKLLLAFEEVRSYVLSVIPTPRRLLFIGSEASVDPDPARVLWSLI